MSELTTEPIAVTLQPVEGSHWYYPDGGPCHEIIAKGTGELRKTTLRDAKKLGLLPSVTNILRLLHKEGLERWKIMQAVTACMTTPKAEEESLDGFIDRVLNEERVQDEESEIARDIGTDIHRAMEALFRGERVMDEIHPWVDPAYKFLKGLGIKVIAVEATVVGIGYAGKLDLVGESPVDNTTLIVDFKSTKRLPEKKSWPEHQLQLAAYAAGYHRKHGGNIKTANLYISTLDCGQFVYYENPHWTEAYENCFSHLAVAWRYMNGYTLPV